MWNCRHLLKLFGNCPHPAALDATRRHSWALVVVVVVVGGGACRHLSVLVKISSSVQPSNVQDFDVLKVKNHTYDVLKVKNHTNDVLKVKNHTNDVLDLPSIPSDVYVL